MRELTPEQKLRHALGMVRASSLLLRRALGAHVLAAGWQPGQPLPEPMQRIKTVEDDLQRALEGLESVVAGLERRGSGAAVHDGHRAAGGEQRVIAHDHGLARPQPARTPAGAGAGARSMAGDGLPESPVSASRTSPSGDSAQASALAGGHLAYGPRNPTEAAGSDVVVGRQRQGSARQAG